MENLGFVIAWIIIAGLATIVLLSYVQCVLVWIALTSYQKEKRKGVKKK